MKIGLDQARGFDFHCHVDLHGDPAQFISQCEGERIVTVAVTTTPKAWTQNRKWTAQSGYVHAAVGLHPELVGERYGELDLLAHCMSETRLIGEVGLDGSPKHREHFGRQREVFERVLKTAQVLGGRVLTIHSRRAAHDVIEMIEKHTSPDRVLPILHWFSGNAAEASRGAACGCYFSINTAMLDSERGQALVRKVPPERLLTETDSQFTRIGNRHSVPWDVNLAIDGLAFLFRKTNEDIRAAVGQNAMRVLRFADLAGNDDHSGSSHMRSR
jgi:TatD DNase family protein